MTCVVPEDMSMKVDVPKFVVVFEGGEAAGKTTQVRRLANALESGGFSVASTGVFCTRHGSFVRQWLMDVEQASFASLRSQVFLLGSAMNQVVDEIETSHCQVVLVDRFVYTTMAYHGGGLSLGVDVVRDIYAPVLARLVPDLVVFFDLPPEVITTRKIPCDRVEAQPLDFHARVLATFRSIFAELPYATTLDANRPIDDVYSDLERLVFARVVSLRKAGLL